MLLNTGYLTLAEQPDPYAEERAALRIPNLEIRLPFISVSVMICRKSRNICCKNYSLKMEQKSQKSGLQDLLVNGNNGSWEKFLNKHQTL